MVGGVSSWISKAVVQYDRKNGSNLKPGVSGIKRLVQIQKFLTYRKPHCPQAQIIALISDKTHRIVAEFDVEATNIFESEDSDLPPERLTSKLRHIIIIKSYRWKLGPPQSRTEHGLDIPDLKMEILDFAEHSGSSDDPNYSEGAAIVGYPEEDGLTLQVLRKWYFGESHSDMSEIEKSFERSQPSQPQAGSSRLAMSSTHNTSNLPEGIISLAEFLEPYLAEGGSKKGKAIPDWLFETSEEDQAALEAITMFGLDLNPTDAQDEGRAVKAQSDLSPSASPAVRSARLDKGKGRAQPIPPPPERDVELEPAIEVSSGDELEPGFEDEAESEPEVEPEVEAEPAIPKSSINTTFAQTPPVPLGQRMRSTQTATQVITLPVSSGGPADDEGSDSESDEEMVIKPLRSVRPTQRSRLRGLFDPLAYPEPEQNAPKSPARVAEEAGSDGETDSDMLSDYERQSRLKRKRTRTASPPAKTTTDEPLLPAKVQEEDESIPASESIESYSLTKQYPSPTKRQPKKLRRESDEIMAVDHGVGTTTESLENSDESLKSNVTKGTGTGTGSGSLPTPPPSDHEPEAQLPSLESEARSQPMVDEPRSQKQSQPSPSPRKSLSSPSKNSMSQHVPTTGIKPHIEEEVSEVHERRQPQTAERPQHRDRDIKLEASSSRKPLPSMLYAKTNEASSSRRTLPIRPAVVVDRSLYSLDLTVPGLSKDTIQQYIDKVRAARSAAPTQRQPSNR